jgi:putative flippase GtrA
MDGLLKQIAKFATIGVGATAIHVVSALLLNSIAKFSALQANFLAFLAASAFTYGGNYFWTFAKIGAVSSTLMRFIFLSLSCFAVNQSIVYFVTYVLQLPLGIAMIPVVVVIPAFSFWVSKTRVFVLPNR